MSVIYYADKNNKIHKTKGLYLDDYGIYVTIIETKDFGDFGGKGCSVKLINSDGRNKPLRSGNDYDIVDYKSYESFIEDLNKKLEKNSEVVNEFKQKEKLSTLVEGQSIVNESEQFAKVRNILRDNSDKFKNEKGEINRTAGQYQTKDGELYLRFHALSDNGNGSRKHSFNKTNKEGYCI